jgi:UDP-3-O-[3-hydroxymyristoyl] glucosamine N-acyltransferase
MSVHIAEILSGFPGEITLTRGSSDAVIDGMNEPSLATVQQMIFVGNKEHLRNAGGTKSSIWLVSPELESQVPSTVTHVLRSAQVQLCMARIAQRFFRPSFQHQIIKGERIHPSAHIAASARLGEGTIVGPGAVIGEDCQIADHCIIGANAVIEPRVKIGARSHIHPLVFIAHSCEIGADCEIKSHSTIGSEGFGYAQDKAFHHHKITHFGRVIVEDRVHIGANVQIDRGTFLDSRIGEGTKIDNHSHFGHNIEIGKNTLVVAGMLAAGSTKIGSYCVIGGRVTVKGHLAIGDQVRIAGLSAIGKSLTGPAEYAGHPLQPLAEELRTRAVLKKLPKLAKQVQMLLKQLGLAADEDRE